LVDDGSLSQIGTLKYPLACKIYLLPYAFMRSMMAISGIQMLIIYIQLGMGLNPRTCGFPLSPLRESCSPLRINNLILLAKLDWEARSLGISIALVSGVE